VARIDHPETERGVVGAAFSPCGRRLVTVTADDSHTVRIWDWRKAGVGGGNAANNKTVGLVGEGKGYKERPPAVHGVVWNPFYAGVGAGKGGGQFATYGTNHVKLWRR
jgi:WD40 repeat protein